MGVRGLVVVQAKERRNERMSQQNQKMAEELQKRRAAKTREEVEVIDNSSDALLS